MAMRIGNYLFMRGEKHCIVGDIVSWLEFCMLTPCSLGNAFNTIMYICILSMHRPIAVSKVWLFLTSQERGHDLVNRVITEPSRTMVWGPGCGGKGDLCS